MPISPERLGQPHGKRHHSEAQEDTAHRSHLHRLLTTISLPFRPPTTATSITPNHPPEPNPRSHRARRPSVTRTISSSTTLTTTTTHPHLQPVPPPVVYLDGKAYSCTWHHDEEHDHTPTGRRCCLVPVHVKVRQVEGQRLVMHTDGKGLWMLAREGDHQEEAGVVGDPDLRLVEAPRHEGGRRRWYWSYVWWGCFGRRCKEDGERRLRCR
ncbi:hypothetical protein GE09DRAFT_1164460 [Coniochaeta sp. 2T2.1]|nr:hypothetical protein GE09DRAFT_1164460 [Coniochaeta sp. 2T2.1]